MTSARPNHRFLILLLALLAAGIASGLSADSKTDELRNAADRGAVWSEEGVGLTEDRERAHALRLTGLIGGAVALAAGAVLLVLDYRADSPAQAAVGAPVVVRY